MRVLLVVGATLLVLASGAHGLTDTDTWWNLASGLSRLSTGAPPPPSVFGAHGCPDLVEQHHAIAEVAMSLAYRGLDLWGLVLLRFLLIGLLVVLAHRTLTDELGSTDALCWTAVVVAAASLRFNLRPELFGMVCFACSVPLVRSALDVSKRPWPFVAATLVVFAVWSNTHSSLPLGVLCVGAYAAGRAFEVRTRAHLLRAVAITGAAALPALTILDNRASLGSERAVGHATKLIEWYSPLTLIEKGWRDPILGALAVLLVAFVLSLLRKSVRDGVVSSALPFVGVAVLGLDAVRHLGFVALSALYFLPLLGPMLAAPRTRMLLRTLAMLATAGALAPRVMTSPLPASIGDETRLVPRDANPVEAERYLRTSNATGVVFASLAASNWILFRAPPGIAIVLSGRRTYSAACGEELFLARRDGGAAFDVVDRRLQPQYVLVSLGEERTLLTSLLAKGFAIVHLDLWFALLARSSTAPPHVEVGEAPPGPDSAARLVRACSVLVEARHPDEGLALCERAIAAAPDWPPVRVDVAKLLQQGGLVDEARQVLAPLLDDAGTRALDDDKKP